MSFTDLMNKTLSTATVLLLAAAAQVASAEPVAKRFVGSVEGDRGIASGLHDWDHDSDHRNGSTVAAPEISPGSLIAALSLLGGALIVLRGRSNTRPTS
jgi:hypothetical protein